MTAESGTAEREVDGALVDDDFIGRAVRAANPNVLRVTLVQLTGDPELAKMERVQIPTRGGAEMVDSLSAENAEVVHRKATEYLRSGDRGNLPVPSSERLRELMTMLSGENLTDPEFRFAEEELALDDFPRDVKWAQKPPAETVSGFHVVVVGAGVCGLALGVQLQRLGISYAIYERAPGIGGVWEANTYPECRVDVTSFMYQFKFEKNFPWKEYFSTQSETKRYLEHIATKYGVADSITLSTLVKGATWDEAASRWHVELEDANGTRTVKANAVISASGAFSTPRMPDIPGIDQFAGKVFHTARWDHSVDLTGKRVALIGNGSSGSQLMPYAAERASRLSAFQRTPAWVAPMPGYHDAVPAELGWLFDNLPYFWNWYCFATYIASVRLQRVQEVDEEWKAGGGLVSPANDTLRAALTQYIRSKTEDVPGLFEKCLPAYAPMARRLVIDNGWFDALHRDNVELVTDGIARITPHGIITKTGEEFEVDVILLGAGFEVSRFLAPADYVGREGVRLEDLWSTDGGRAHLGMVVPGFPNLFICAGPDGAPRATSHYTFAEIWARYILQAVTHLIESGNSSIEVREDVYKDYNSRLDEASRHMIWSQQGQGGYFINKFGRSNFAMPWRVEDFHELTIKPSLEDYVLRK